MIKTNKKIIILLIMFAYVVSATDINACGDLSTNGDVYNIIVNIGALDNIDTSCLYIYANNSIVNGGGYQINGSKAIIWGTHGSNAIEIYGNNNTLYNFTAYSGLKTSNTQVYSIYNHGNNNTIYNFSFYQTCKTIDFFPAICGYGLHSTNKINLYNFSSNIFLDGATSVNSPLYIFPTISIYGNNSIIYNYTGNTTSFGMYIYSSNSNISFINITGNERTNDYWLFDDKFLLNIIGNNNNLSEIFLSGTDSNYKQECGSGLYGNNNYINNITSINIGCKNLIISGNNNSLYNSFFNFKLIKGRIYYNYDTINDGILINGSNNTIINSISFAGSSPRPDTGGGNGFRLINCYNNTLKNISAYGGSKNKGDNPDGSNGNDFIGGSGIYIYNCSYINLENITNSIGGNSNISNLTETSGNGIYIWRSNNITIINTTNISSGIGFKNGRNIYIVDSNEILLKNINDTQMITLNYSEINIFNFKVSGIITIYNFTNIPTVKSHVINLSSFLNISLDGNLTINYSEINLSNNPAIEDKLDFYKYDSTWIKQNGTLNMSLKTINITGTILGLYGLLSYPTDCLQTIDIFQRNTSQTYIFGDNYLYALGVRQINNSCTHNAINTYYNYTDYNEELLSTSNINVTNQSMQNLTFSFRIPITTNSLDLGISIFEKSKNKRHSFITDYNYSIFNLTVSIPLPNVFVNPLVLYKCEGEQVQCPVNSLSYWGSSLTYSINSTHITRYGDSLLDLFYIISYEETEQSSQIGGGENGGEVPTQPEEEQEVEPEEQPEEQEEEQLVIESETTDIPALATTTVYQITGGGGGTPIEPSTNDINVVIGGNTILAPLKPIAVKPLVSEKILGAKVINSLSANFKGVLSLYILKSINVGLLGAVVLLFWVVQSGLGLMQIGLLTTTLFFGLDFMIFNITYLVLGGNI